MTTVDLGLQWEVSCDFKPTNYDHNDYTSILHLTIGGDREKLGDRNPAIFYSPLEGLYLATAADSNPDQTHKIKPPPPVGEWTNIVVSQLEAWITPRYTNIMSFRGPIVWYIKIGDAEPIRIEILRPQNMSSVKVYVSDPWYQAQP